MASGPQYCTEFLIENIKRRCLVPTSQLTYEDDGFCALATDSLQDEVVPLIMTTREEYFVKYYDVSSPADGVIDFPSTTVASKVRSICYVQQTSPLVLVNIPRIDLDIVAGVGFASMNTMAGFYIQGNQFILYPNTSVPTGTQIRVYYYKRALALIEPASYGRVTAINTGTNTLTLDNFPFDWTTATVLNSVSSDSPFETTNEELAIVALSSPDVQLDTVEGIEVGDYISEQGYSAVPQIPIEAHGYLAQLTAAKLLEGLGDREGEAAAMKKADALKVNMLSMMSQRVDGSTKVVMAASGGLRLNAGLGRRRGAGNGFW